MNRLAVLGRLASLRRPFSLRTAFDQPSRTRPAQSSTTPAGIFGYPGLRQPADLLAAAGHTLQRAALIVARITHRPAAEPAEPRARFRACITQFDRLSDALCRIIDLAEALRNLHPDHAWLDAANQAHSLLSRYMNTLNTHQALYQTLHSALDHPEVNHPDLFAAKTVALQFLRDFQRHGIHLPEDDRRKLVEISDEMLTVGQLFFSGSAGSLEPTWVTRGEAGEIGSGFVAGLDFAGRGGRAALDPSEWPAHMLLRQHPSEAVRRRIWLAQRQAPDAQVALLDGLLRLRYQFARLTGKDSWADIVLEDKMAANARNVTGFLDGLAATTRPIALAELQRLAPGRPAIAPWDRDFYGHLAASKAQKTGHPALPAYFSVGRCLEGLSLLFTRIYGISFHLETPDGPGELWHPSVVKLAVLDDREGRLGTIYCDLFDRPGKSPGAAHYTVRCSRRTDLDQPHLDPSFFHTLDPSTPLLDHIYPHPLPPDPLPSPAAKREGLPGTFQRPIVVFSCSFSPPCAHSDSSPGQPSLLAWSDVETLFHEMGHAIHSMVGQTEFHNVSGTRCATDWVELPSILMEHFASSAETYHQVELALLDQRLHSARVARSAFSCTNEHAALERQYALFAPQTEDRWVARFGHLYGYGAAYYAYLFDRVIARKIVARLYDDNGSGPAGMLDRAKGERIKTALLAPGGSRDPWHCLQDLLGHDELGFDGPASAVMAVTRWGLWK
ncbi:hypothetical protein PtB15_4B634 [Puccinia triticina]|nr:hypothetical protein PtB15_4B634 [Puccinia triticina]